MRNFPIAAMDGKLVLRGPTPFLYFANYRAPHEENDLAMAKPHRGLKKANHGRRPANSKARRLKRRDIRT
jgi:hypothetical protein